MKNVILLCTSVLLILGCVNDTEEPVKTLKKDEIFGYVQKGPFINGTSITISELNSSLGQTGKTFKSQILDNGGNFKLENIELSSPFVQLEANGFYFDEVVGDKSEAPLTLYALSNVTNKDQVNINVLTHLEKGRVEFLTKGGMEFNEAKNLARHEILNIFGVDQDDVASSESLDITQNSVDNATLIAVSIILQAGNTVADLSELLANINTDIRQDGTLDSESLKASLFNSTKSLNLESIRNNLKNRYESMGITAEIPDFESIIYQYLSFQTPFGIIPRITNVSCQGQNNGAIEISIDGGTPPYTYMWSNGKTTNKVVDLEPGYYSIEVIDANNFTLSKSDMQITEPEELIAAFTTTEVTEINGTNGSIDLTVTGGTSPYSFTWSNGLSTEDIGDLPVGEYIVNIADSNQCQITKNITIDYILELLKPIDGDGNEYEIVKIGSQIWMAENLRTTSYNDGTPIQLVADGSAWDNMQTAAYCWYDNDSISYAGTYGALYNWYAANSNKLCPIGWHLSSWKEWEELSSYLGGQTVAGGKLKEQGTEHWLSPNTAATNEVGFNALPGGGRGPQGTFYNNQKNAMFWTDWENTSDTAWGFGLKYDNGNLSAIGPGFKLWGHSVRCIRD